MPATHCSTTIAAVSETQGIPAATCKRKRYSSASIASKTELVLTGAGRNRHLEGLQLESSATTTASPKRKCRASVVIAATSQLECKRLAVLVNVPAPTGKLLVTGLPLAGARLLQGVSQELNFAIDGERIVGLQILFTAIKLDGTPVVNKTLLGVPGGLILEDPIALPSGGTSLIGIVPLYPHETIQPEKEVELRYTLTMSDPFSRKYLLESGTFSVYKD